MSILSSNRALHLFFLEPFLFNWVNSVLTLQALAEHFDLQLLLIAAIKTLIAQLVFVKITILLREDVRIKLISRVSVLRTPCIKNFWISWIEKWYHERLFSFRTQALWGLLVKWLAETTVNRSTAHSTAVMQVTNLRELLSHAELAQQVQTVLLMHRNLFLKLNLWAINNNLLLAFLFLSYFTTWSTTHHIDLLLQLQGWVGIQLLKDGIKFVGFVVQLSLQI